MILQHCMKMIPLHCSIPVREKMMGMKELEHDSFKNNEQRFSSQGMTILMII